MIKEKRGSKSEIRKQRGLGKNCINKDGESYIYKINWRELKGVNWGNMDIYLVRKEKIREEVNSKKQK